MWGNIAETFLFLGVGYLFGFGTLDMDKAEAAVWFKKAATMGSRRAREMRQLL